MMSLIIPTAAKRMTRSCKRVCNGRFHPVSLNLLIRNADIEIVQAWRAKCCHSVFNSGAFSITSCSHEKRYQALLCIHFRVLGEPGNEATY